MELPFIVRPLSNVTAAAGTAGVFTLAQIARAVVLMSLTPGVTFAANVRTESACGNQLQDSATVFWI
jgi:hypothetical protein